MELQRPSLNTIIPQISALPKAVYLDNGVEVQQIPLPSTDLVAISIMFQGGQWVQGKKLQSNYAIQQIISGTHHLTSEALADQLDYYGATITTGATIAYCFLKLTCLRRTLPDVLPILYDILTSPSYEQQKLDNALEEGLLAYQMNEQKVEQVSRRIFYQHLLGKKNPAAHYPDEKDYRSLTREDLICYHRQYLTLSNAVIYLTGKTDETLLTLLNQHLGHTICAQQPNCTYTPFPVTTSAQHLQEITLPIPSVQSGLRLGNLMPDSNSEDFPVLQLTSTIIGGYFGSRLMKNIRERLGLTYGIGSNYFHIPYHNVFFIATETPKEHVAKCISEIKKDLIDLQNHPVSDEEMNNARNYRLGQFCRVTETSLSLSTLLMLQRSQGRTLTDLLKEQETIQSLTTTDIMLCTQKYFDPQDMLIAVAHGK